MSKEKPEKEKLSLVDFMLKEAEDTFRMLRADREKVIAVRESRKKQITQLEAEQDSDERKQIKLEGAMSATQHLITKYKEAWAKSPERIQKRTKHKKKK